MGGLFACLLLFQPLIVFLLKYWPFRAGAHITEPSRPYHIHILFSTIQYWLQKVLSTLYLSNFYFKMFVQPQKASDFRSLFRLEQNSNTISKHSFGSSNQKFNDFFSPFFYLRFFSSSPFESLKIDQMLRKHKWHERNGNLGERENENGKKWSINWIQRNGKKKERNQRCQTEWIENCGGKKHDEHSLRGDYSEIEMQYVFSVYTKRMP